MASKKSPLEGSAAWWNSLSPEEQKERSARHAESFEEEKKKRKAAEEEKERLKWAGTGTCSACQGKVITVKVWHSWGEMRYGGKPNGAYQATYHCEQCGLVYKFLPPDKERCTGGT